jgi:NADH-quinone oxidoreductase subunit L
MTVALGASAYAAGIFHLFTHAFFKALLFLAAGSVIIAMHHDQDIRNMGGLRKYMPITWITSLIGTLALIGFPGFSGFYSKDAIIEAVHASALPGAGIAYVAVLLGVFVTALYSFRMYFLVFHGEERMDEHTREHLHEAPWVIWLPLVLLAIPSVVAGALYAAPMLFGTHFGDSIHVAAEHDTLAQVAEHFDGALSFAVHGLVTAPFWLAVAGFVTAWVLYVIRPDLPARIRAATGPVHGILERKYGFDEFNQWFFAGGVRGIGRALWHVGDEIIIDGLLVNGSAKLVGWVSGIVRHVQTGLLFHYAFVMIIGLLVLIGAFVTR